MKKFAILVFILFASFMCTACINNLAIQELNQMGKEYLDKGDYENAIGRFQSSVDLDENVFESRYNLGVAYIAKEDYKNAVGQLEAAVKINPESADAYYSYAVALESYAFSYFEPKEPTEDFGDAIIVEDEIDPSVADEYLKNADKSVKMYEKYLAVSPDAKDKETVLEHIKEVQNRIIEYKNKYVMQDNMSK